MNRPVGSGRWLNRLTWALVLSPVILCVIYFTLVLRERLEIGSWDSWLGVGSERILTAAGVFTIWGALPLWLMLVCVQRFGQAWSMKRATMQALVFVVGCVVALTVAVAVKRF